MSHSDSPPPEDKRRQPAMNPITLEFLDPDLETELRSTQFRASTFVAELMLVVMQAVHVFMSWFASKYHVISLIYSPLIVIAFVGRHRFAQMEDQGRAHDLNGKMWCLLILIGNTLQRASIFFGLHPIIDMVEATLYVRIPSSEKPPLFASYHPRDANSPLLEHARLRQPTAPDWPLTPSPLAVA